MKQIESFFKPLRLEHPVSEADYQRIQPYIEALSGFSRIANASIYVIDYYTKNFVYISSNPLFLCGYDIEEVKKLGYDFYAKVVSPEDLSMLLEINEKGFEYFYSQELKLFVRTTFLFIFAENFN